MEKEDKLMIKKIAIVPYVTNGKNSQVGHDGHFNIFKKKRSTVLKEYLQLRRIIETVHLLLEEV